LGVRRSSVAIGAVDDDVIVPGGVGVGSAGRRVKVEDLGIGPSGRAVRPSTSPPPERPGSPMPEALRLEPLKTPAVPVLDEVAVVLERFAETVWGDMRAVMADVVQAFGTGYPGATGYAAQREEVSVAMEEAQKRAWVSRGRLLEMAAYVKGQGAEPVWWPEQGRAVGGRGVEGKGKERETGGGVGKRKAM
jgi:hypothetical protein